jgi:hypothetical protein
VVADKPSPQADEAARILQTYVERISGARLPILNETDARAGRRIVVGFSPLAAKLVDAIPSGFTRFMNEEGFVIKTVGTDLVLAGNESWHYRGTVFAVYDFLERLGCRWFFPGPFGEVLPTRKTLTVDALDVMSRPDFRMRDIHYSGWFPTGKQDQAWFRTWKDQHKMAALPISLPGDGTITALAPATQYFKSHPHIYALDKKGKRREDMLCLSEPETVRIAVNTVKAAFHDNPERHSFAFAPPDGFPVCYCEPCQAAIPGFTGKGYGDPSLSDSWFRFANRVAAEVYAEFPDRWVLTNGYANRVRPPESLASFSPNLGIQSAVIAACVLHRVGDPTCWQRKLYKQVLDRWTDAVDFVLIYDYDPGNSLVNLPFPALHNLRYDIPYFKQRGVWGFWTEGTNTWFVTHLNYYVRAKLMWDVETDVDALVRDYCEKFYGRAAKDVETYIQTLEDAVEHTTIHETWGRLMNWRVVLRDARPKLDDFMLRAETHAEDPVVKSRVAVLRLVHDHMNAYIAMEEAVARGAFREAVASADAMLKLRDTVGEVQSGLLPHTPKQYHSFRTTLEWHRTMYAGLAERTDGTRGERLMMLPRRWEFKKDPKDIGVLYQWYRAGVGDPWETADTTTYWEAQGHQDAEGWSYTGKAWYRTSFDVPANVADKPVMLTIGAVYNRADYNRGIWVWVNGVMRDFEADRHHRLGHHDVRTPIDIDVTDVLRAGEVNTVAVLVHTAPPGRNPRGGMHRRSFLWSPK